MNSVAGPYEVEELLSSNELKGIFETGGYLVRESVAFHFNSSDPKSCGTHSLLPQTSNTTFFFLFQIAFG